MYKIVGKTCSGKTKKLLLAAEKEGGTVMCRNPERMLEKAHSLGIVGLPIIGYKELPADNSPLFIDDLDSFLKESLGSLLAGYTLSCDD